MFESSFNTDRSVLDRFFPLLLESIEEGYSDSQVRDLLIFVDSVPVDSKDAISLNIKNGGGITELYFAVSKDSGDLSLMFLSENEITIKLIQDVYLKHAESIGL